MDGTDDEFGIQALDQVAQFARAAGGIGLGIFSRKFHFATGDAAALIDNVDRGFGGFVVPVAPRRNHAGEVAMMADHNRA